MVPIRTQNRKAISAVLTTIIILVASIVLGTGVVVFSTGLFQSGGQQSAVQVQGLKTWVNATSTTGYAWGAFAVKNTGDKILSLTSINIRSASIPYTNWYADTDQIRVGLNFQQQLNATKMDNNGNIKGSILTGVTVNNPAGAAVTGCVNTGVAAPSQQTSNPPTVIEVQLLPLSPATNSPLCMAQQSGPVGLSPGASAIVYYKMPNGLLTPSDSGVTSTTSILAGTAPISQTVRIATP